MEDGRKSLKIKKSKDKLKPHQWFVKQQQAKARQKATLKIK